MERSLRLKWLTMSFPTSIIPAILFLNFADDALQVTSPKAQSASKTFSWRLRLGSLEVNATLLQLCGSRWRSSRKLSPRLARQCGSQEKQRVQASGSNLEVLLNNVRTLGSTSSVEESGARMTGRRSLS